MPEYIDQTQAIGDFGDVRDARATFEGTIDGVGLGDGADGIAGGLRILPPVAPQSPPVLPTWVIVALVVGFILITTSD